MKETLILKNPKRYLTTLERKSWVRKQQTHETGLIIAHPNSIITVVI